MTSNKNSITVLIHSYNDEKNMQECIKSAKLLSDDIVVVDTESTDKTVEIAKKNGANIFSFPQLQYVEPSREFGIEQVKKDWVFILDTDERVTKELADEIHRAIKSTEFTSYKVPRKNIYGGKKWLKHGGWWPDQQIRLIKKSSFRSWPKEIHSTPVIEGRQGILRSHFLHFFHGDLTSMVKKTIIYESIEADHLYKAGKSVRTLTFMRKFTGELFRRLIRDRGFLDGRIGIIESIYQAFSKTITYLYLYEKRQSRAIRPLP